MPIYHFHSADYEQKTGGWIYNRHLVRWLAENAGGVSELSVPACFPAPDAATLTRIDTLFERIEPGALLVMDHIYGCMLLPILRDRPFRLVSIYHHSLTEERAGEGGDTAGLAPVEAAVLQLSHAVIVTSTESRDYLRSHYAIAEEKIITAPPGNAPARQSLPHQTGDWHFLSVGAVIPRKHHEFMIDALAGLQAKSWSLTIVGNTHRYPDHVAALARRIAGAGLSDRIAFTGELTAGALDKLWCGTHLYLASSLYEGYGMAISEALCRGIPVISTPSGAVASWAGPAALLVFSNDPAEMAASIETLVTDPAAYAMARHNAAAFGREMQTWDEAMARAGQGLARIVLGTA